MGINCTTYLMLGIKLPYSVVDECRIYEGENEEKYLPYIEGHKDIKYSLIIDSMNGEYCIFGAVIERLNKEKEDQFYIINNSTSKGQELFDEEEYEKVFNDLFPHIKLEEPKYSLIMFNHYS
jgi:hypothetical protein